MKSFDQRLSDLLLDVYEAAANPAHWTTFLENVARELDATKAALHVHYFAPGNTIQTAHGSCAIAVGYDGSSLADYANYYAAQDIYVQRIRERFPLGMQVGTSEDLITSNEYRRTELYHDFSRPNGVFYTCWSAVEQSNRMAAGLGFIRPENAKPFEAKDVNLLKLLNPHLNKAFHLQRIMEHANEINKALLTSIAQFDFGLLALDQQGRVTNISAPAKALLDEHDGIRLRNGSLEAVHLSEDRKLQDLLRVVSSICDNPDRQRGGALLISRQSGKRPLQLSVFPSVSSGLMFEEHPRMLVLLSDPAAKPVSRASVLRDLYGLTPTESRLADLLLQGFEVREAAEALHTTLETTRFHLKRVLAKTGTRRQSELMRLMLSLPGNRLMSI